MTITELLTMKSLRFLFLFVLTLCASSALAQQSCLCTAGCKLASDPYPAGAGQPTTCTVYKGGVSIASGSVVASSTIATSNGTVCLPASAPYVPGPSTNVSCEVTIPAQVAGAVTITMTASDGAGESSQSAPYTFQSVSILPTLPIAPTNPRPN